MRQIAGSFMAIALLAAGPVAACSGGDHAVISTRKDNGTQVGLFISPAQIKETPTWNPELGDPPLSVSAAYRASKEWADERYARYDGVHIRRISIWKYDCYSTSDRWYYLVDMNPVIDGNEIWSGGYWTAVLMDGTVIGSREY